MLANRVERGRYLDSVALMRVSRSLEALSGVESAALMIGSPSNKALLRGAGLLAREGEAATPNDLITAVRARDERSAAAALEHAMQLLSEVVKSGPKIETVTRARSLAGALELMPRANLALISVPGEFAAHEARRALGRGLHVLLFSDNVPLEDEAALKRFAGERGLLLMGPDCGTAIIAGTPLAFANVVPRGSVGIVSASGTGLQEVSTLIARMGGGVSHGIGVGGRDLDTRVGALGTLAALDALEADPGTERIVLISKPPAPGVARRVLERVKSSTKPCVVCFLGLDARDPGHAATLTEAAERAIGRKLEPFPAQAQRKLHGKRIEGLYCGGTLCAEAELIFRRKGLEGHRFVDLGDDEYTRGRPHPMIEPAIRNDHIARAIADPGVGAILLDVVLGFGAHENPAGVLLEALTRGKPVIVSVTGTEQDPQVWSRQVARLREAGLVVAASNAHAAELAAGLVS